MAIQTYQAYHPAGSRSADQSGRNASELFHQALDLITDLQSQVVKDILYCLRKVI